MVVVDSVAALVPKAELDGEMGDSHMGLHARLMSQALRKLTGAVARTNTCMVFINQMREKIGVMFGNPETTTGGRALKFYASVRVDIRRIAAIKDGDTVVGNRTASRWSRIKSRRHSAKPSSISFMARGSRGRAICWIWARRTILWKKGTDHPVEHGPLECSPAGAIHEGATTCETARRLAAAYIQSYLRRKSEVSGR